MSYLSGMTSKFYFATMLVIDCVQTKQTLCACMRACTYAWECACGYVFIWYSSKYNTLKSGHVGVYRLLWVEHLLLPSVTSIWCRHYTIVCMFQVIETAFTALKTSTTDPFYRRQCWEVIRCFLVASLNLDDDKNTMQQLFSYPRYITTILGCCKMWAWIGR